MNLNIESFQQMLVSFLQTQKGMEKYLKRQIDDAAWKIFQDMEVRPGDVFLQAAPAKLLAIANKKLYLFVTNVRTEDKTINFKVYLFLKYPDGSHALSGNARSLGVRKFLQYLAESTLIPVLSEELQRMKDPYFEEVKSRFAREYPRVESKGLWQLLESKFTS